MSDGRLLRLCILDSVLYMLHILYMVCRMVSIENGGAQFSQVVISTLLPHLMRERTQKTRTKKMLATAWKSGSSAESSGRDESYAESDESEGE